jgi:hypothetical protein
MHLHYTRFHPELVMGLLDCTLKPRLFHYFIQYTPLVFYHVSIHNGHIAIVMIRPARSPVRVRRQPNYLAIPLRSNHCI